MSTTTRKRCLRGQEHCRPESIKEALDCVGHHSAQPLPVIAERIGRVVNTLAKECSLYDDEHTPPLRLVVPLTLASGNDALIRHLAEACGGVFFRVPAQAEVSANATAIARIVREFGQLLEEVACATADGVVTLTELTRVRHEANDVMAAIASYLERLAQTAPASASHAESRS